VKRSRKVSMGAVVVLAAALLGGCAEEPTGPTGDYDELCVNEQEERVPDEWCEDGNEHRGGSHPVYVPYHHGKANPAFPIGSKVTGGTSIKPASGTFVRGGFGGVRGGGG
jgi:hypothetical protein